MEWFAQGENDGLCGLYASLNAVSCLLEMAGKPIQRDDRQLFFDTAIDCLMQNDALQGANALQILKGNHEDGGINSDQIAKLCRTFSMKFGLVIEVEEKGEETDGLTFRAMLKKEVDNDGKFVIIVVEKDESHWVAIARHRQKGFFLLMDNSRPVRRSMPQLRAKFIAKYAVILRLIN